MKKMKKMKKMEIVGYFIEKNFRDFIYEVNISHWIVYDDMIFDTKEEMLEFFEEEGRVVVIHENKVFGIPYVVKDIGPIHRKIKDAEKIFLQHFPNAEDKGYEILAYSEINMMLNGIDNWKKIYGQLISDLKNMGISISYNERNIWMCKAEIS